MCISGSMLHVYVILYASTCTFLVHTCIHTYRYTYIHTDIYPYIQTYVHTDRHTYILFAGTETHTWTHTQTYTHTLSLSLITHSHALPRSSYSLSHLHVHRHTPTHTHTCQETEGLGCIPNGTPTTVHVYCHRRHLHPGITANVRRRSSGLSMPPCLHTN